MWKPNKIRRRGRERILGVMCISALYSSFWYLIHECFVNVLVDIQARFSIQELSRHFYPWRKLYTDRLLQKCEQYYCITSMKSLTSPWIYQYCIFMSPYKVVLQQWRIYFCFFVLHIQVKQNHTQKHQDISSYFSHLYSVRACWVWRPPHRCAHGHWVGRT